MIQLTIQQAFDLAIQYHRAGRLQEAEPLYREILREQPENADALHYLGVIANQVGRYDVAADLIRRAISLKPDNPEAHSNLANVLTEMGQLDDAIAACRQAILLRADYAEAYVNLGNALTAKGLFDEAAAASRHAIALSPNSAEAYNNLGNALADKGQLDEAIAAYRQAVTLRPNYARAHNNLGNAHFEKERMDEAIAAYQQALAFGHHGLPQVHSNLGHALKDLGQIDEAIAACNKAIELDPNYAEAHNNLADARKHKGQIEEAIAACRRAIAIRPNYAEAHANLALALLTRGDYQRGWEEYEWRSRCKTFISRPQNYIQPKWDGSALEGRTLLLHAEQGLGDTLQFIRYLPLVAQREESQRSGKIILECQPELARLFQTFAGICQIVPRGQPVPPCDLQSPLLSLPRLFGTTLANVPSAIPYLHADPDKIKKWKQRMSDHSQFLKIGLVWSGNTSNRTGRYRSMHLQSLAPLAQVPRARFFTLQKGEASSQTRTPPAGLDLIDWTQDLNDFADTAALITNLDLVIAVDTAVLHLAGALGKPVWALLSPVPDWRWPPGEVNPWYPTVRIFRQSPGQDWQSVVSTVAERLMNWSTGSKMAHPT